jgi:peptidoglycan hydrolase-like protein with peptidoglycan-binding domain
MHAGGTQELSKDAMRVVQQSLKSEGYDPGREDGVADDNTRQAIREFQQDKELAMTGVIDQRTAENLGLSWRQSTFDGMESYLPVLRFNLTDVVSSSLSKTSA